MERKAQVRGHRDEVFGEGEGLERDKGAREEMERANVGARLVGAMARPLGTKERFETAELLRVNLDLPTGAED